jgi:hypothetical protein
LLDIVAQPGTNPVEEVRGFYAFPLGDMLMFSTFVYLGYRNRFQPVVHKRLMWFATLSLLDVSFDRWPVFGAYSLPLVNLICFRPLLLLMIGYFWWSKGKVQSVTIWSTIFMVLVQQIRHPLGHTAVWPELRGLGRNAHALVLLKMLSRHSVAVRLTPSSVVARVPVNRQFSHWTHVTSKFSPGGPIGCP